jgi:hypothetical protein
MRWQIPDPVMLVSLVAVLSAALWLGGSTEQSKVPILAGGALQRREVEAI